MPIIWLLSEGGHMDIVEHDVMFPENSDARYQDLSPGNRGLLLAKRCNAACHTWRRTPQYHKLAGCRQRRS